MQQILTKYLLFYHKTQNNKNTKIINLQEKYHKQQILNQKPKKYQHNLKIKPKQYFALTNSNLTCRIMKKSQYLTIIIMSILFFIRLTQEGCSGYNVYQNCPLNCLACDYFDRKSCCQCKSEYYFDIKNYSCYKFQGDCGLDQFGQQRYWNYMTNTCQKNCTEPLRQYKNLISKQCVQQCPNELIMQNQYRQCTDKCRQGFYFINKSSQKTQFNKQFNNNYCYRQCNQQINPRYYYNASKEILFADNFNRICVKAENCPIDPQYNSQTFANNISYLCVSKCPGGTYGHRDSKYCVKTCYGNYPFRNEILNLCSKKDNNKLFQQLFQVESEFSQNSINQNKNRSAGLSAPLLIAIGLIMVFASCIGLCLASVYYCCYKKRKFEQLNSNYPLNSENNYIASQINNDTVTETTTIQLPKKQMKSQDHTLYKQFQIKQEIQAEVSQQIQKMKQKRKYKFQQNKKSSLYQKSNKIRQKKVKKQQYKIQQKQRENEHDDHEKYFEIQQ